MKYLIALLPLTALGCTLTEWGKIAEDVAVEAPPVLTDPVTWSGGVWGLIGGVVAIATVVYRKSLARNFGRAVTAAKNLVGR